MIPESQVAESVEKERIEKGQIEKQRALDAIIHSRTFSRSDQLQRFLRYIGEMELAGRGSDITEYSIATEALHRPPAYAPGEDSSVRSRAHALRRKLDEYYESECPRAELRIELPKGAYRPSFVAPSRAQLDRTQLTVAHLSPTFETLRPQPAQSAIPRRVILWMAAAFLAAIALTLFLSRRFPPDPIDPIVREAWGPVLQRGGDVLILLSAPPLLRPVPSQPGIKPQPQANLVEPAPSWAQQWFEGLKFESRGGPLYLARSRGYSVFSDSIASMAVSSLIASAGGSYHAAPEPAMQPMAIHDTGLVVLGAPAYTQYLARILKATPYSFWFDPALNEEVLGIKADRNAPVYRAKRNPQTTRYSTVYGLITVLPSQPGHPRPERTLLFSGFTGSPGPQAAIDFFRSPAALRDLQERFSRQGYKHFPAAYQVVVRCGVDTENAINAIYETHRIMPAPPVIE
ncbi:MAG: hypothetical protein JWO80_1145 [Bryobacterales bacterium]|nr:hypothetical protein [Bryobacterales bacterium]